MYADYFSLIEKPFSITPDPAYLFLSKRHEEALAHLLYGVTDSGGFIQLTGEVGTGKTTIIRSLFERIPEHVEIALILNPRLSESEFLHAICDELLIPVTKENTNKECFDALNNYLLNAHSKGRKVVLLVDEAQNLAVNVLEYIRLLTNLETDKDKLLQIILVGQPELQTILQRQDLRQLAQRITARYHLVPLNKAESEAYIQHRLKVGGTNHEIFSRGAKQEIFNASKGIPRLINVLADRALLGAYSQEKSRVDAKLAKKVIKEVFGEDKRLTNEKENHNGNWKFSFPVIVGVGIIGVALGLWLSGANVQNYFESKNTQTEYAASTKVEPKSNALRVPSNLDAIKNSSSSTIIPVFSGLVEDKGKTGVETAGSETDANLENKSQKLSNVFSVYKSETIAEPAINNLLKQWGKESFLPGNNLCESIRKINLRCLYRNSSWLNMLRHKRPVILELYDESNAIRHVVVDGIDNERVRLVFKNQKVFVSLPEIITAWRGDYLIFWKPDKDFLIDSIHYGLSGEDVIWLKEKLKLLNIKPETHIDEPYFGAITKRQVQSFQLQSGLVADGIVGSETYVALNNALGLMSRPVLITAFEGSE